MVRISKKSVSEISIFELQRLENCVSRLCPSPLGSPRPPPPKKHPNRVKTHKEGIALLLSIGLCTEVEGLGGGPIHEFSPPPPPHGCPPPMVNGGLEGRAGKDYVSSKLVLPCRRLGWARTPAGELPGAARGAFAGGGGLRASPTENKVGWRPAWEAGCASRVVEGAGVTALFLCPDRRARGPCAVLRCG